MPGRTFSHRHPTRPRAAKITGRHRRDRCPYAQHYGIPLPLTSTSYRMSPDSWHDFARNADSERLPDRLTARITTRRYSLLRTWWNDRRTTR